LQQANSPSAVFQRARQAYAARRYEEALNLAGQLLRIAGPGEEAFNLQALSLLALGRAREARAQAAQALKLNPRAVGVLLNAARMDLALGNRRGAKRLAMDAARLASRDARVLYQSALLSRQAGDYATALRLVDRCQAMDAQLAEARFLKGSMRLDQGERAAARSEFEAALAIQPDHARALADLSRILDDTEEARAWLERLENVRDHARQPLDRSSAAFALADWHHHQGAWDEAATAYDLANRLGAAARHFDLPTWERRQQQTRSDFADLAPAGPPGSGPGAHLVFLVGMPRSGTSLCEQVLGAHGRVLAAGELTTAPSLELDPPGNASEAQLRQLYTEGLPAGHASHQYVTDKLPMNFERVGFLHRLFPGARFIHCRRHPLDTVLSCYQQDFQAGVLWAFDLAHIARVLVQERALMAHWTEQLPEHVLTVDYESLVTDLPGQTRRLADFLDLEFEETMLAPQDQDRTVQTASRLQVRESVYTTSVEKWRRYDALLEPARRHLEQAGVLERPDA
jgi:tetratricopeptide (TPR) repeat protein